MGRFVDDPGLGQLQDRAAVLELCNASKTFNERRVLDGLDLEIKSGEVHGLIGQNGAGKSTVIKILSGVYAPDEGCTLRMRGEPAKLPSGGVSANRLGLAFVHQDLGLVDTASVLENLFIGRFRTRFPGRISWRRERVRAEELLARLRLELSPDTLVGDLSPTERAMVAIARAVDEVGEPWEGKVLVLDEPTSYLPHDGRERLLSLIREAAAQGAGVLFVGHDMDEVWELTDRVTVLRDGRRVACQPTQLVNRDDLVELVLGFRLESGEAKVARTRSNEVLSADRIAGAGLASLSFTLLEGEILGLTGLLGGGYESVPYALFGAAAVSGELLLGGDRIDLRDWTPQAAMSRGLALVPAQRLVFGGVAAASAAENFSLPTLRKYTRAGHLLWPRRERQAAASAMSELAVVPRDPTKPFGTFSGGNQQKLVMAKWLGSDPTILLLHEPVQGVDVGARHDILERLRQLAAGGTSIVIASAEYQDLAEVCHRVLIFRHGAIRTELRGAEVTHEGVLAACFGDRTAPRRRMSASSHLAQG